MIAAPRRGDNLRSRQYPCRADLHYSGDAMASSAPPAPDRALLILANAVAEVVGSRSVAFQRIVLAAGTQARDDHARACEAFDSLPGAQRHQVKGRAETAATAVRQRAVLRGVLKNLPRWRPDNVEWIWPLSSRPAATGDRVSPPTKKGP